MADVEGNGATKHRQGYLNCIVIDTNREETGSLIQM